MYDYFKKWIPQLFEHITLCLIDKKDIPKSIDLNFTKILGLLEMVDTPKRRESYLMSRYALQGALKKEKTFIPLDSLILQNHCEIYSFPFYKASITHSKEKAAAVITKSSKIKSLGVDIEDASRQMQKGSHKYFINEKDKLETFSDLEKWVIKEACYKSASNSLQQEFLLKDVVCTKNQFFYNELEGFFKLEYIDNYCVVVAYVPL